MHEPETRDAEIRAFFERLAAETPPEARDIAGAVRKARRRIAVAWIGAIVIAAVVIGSIGVAIDRADEAWTPQPAGSGRTFTAGALRELVLSEERDITRLLGASGMPGRLVRSAPQDASIVTVEDITELSRADLADAGMTDGYVGWFSTPAFDSDRGGTSLVSLAMRFPDADHAHRGLMVFRRGVRAVWATGRISPVDGLGDGGFLVDGRIWDSPGLTFVWRVDNVVLFLGSEGHFTVPGFRTLAEEMDRRAATRASQVSG